MRKILLIVIIALIAVTSFQIWMTGDRTSQKKDLDQIAGQGEAQIGGPFTLVDQDGKTVHDTDYHGQLLLVYFGFTQCPDVCPTTLLMLSKAMTLLGDKANQVIPIFISVDPAHDTPAVLKDYLSNFDKRMVGLTGTEAQIESVQNAYKVYATKKENTGGPYSIDHSSYIYLMGKNGKFLAVLPYNATEQEVSAAVERYLGQL